MDGWNGINITNALFSSLDPQRKEGRASCDMDSGKPLSTLLTDALGHRGLVRGGGTRYPFQFKD